MGINRYEHIPQYNPPILPYDLVMKAADMKQQRWDKAVGTAQDNFNDIFSKTKAIATSEDERIVLPELRKQFNDELSKMVSDPSMTAEQLSIRANGLIGNIQPSLNKINDSYTMHTTALAEKMKNEGDATWSATNQYVGGPDLFNWNSLKNGDLSQLNYKSRTSIEPVVRPYLNAWADTTIGQEQYTDPTTGKVTLLEKKGKDFSGLLNVAKVNALDYMNTNNFHQWKDDYVGVKPDDILKDTPGYTQTFGGKKFEELSNMDQAKAMIMFQGVKQINSDASKLAGPSGNGNGKSSEETYTNNPWFQAESSNNWAPSDIGLALGMENYDQTTNSFRNITAGNQFFNTPATISTFASPKEAATASIVQDLAQEPSTSGVLNILEKELPDLQNSDVGKQAAALEGIDLYGDNGYTMKTTRAALKSLPENDPDKVAIRNYEKQKAGLEQKARAAFAELKKSPRFLEAQSIALKAGIDLNSSDDINKLISDYKTIKSKMAKDQVANLGTAMIDLGGYDWTPQTGNNIVNIEDKKFVKGFQDIPANFDLLDQTLVPYLKSKGWNVAESGYAFAPDVGAPNIDSLFEKMIAEGKMTKVVKGDKEYFRIPMNLEVPMKDPLVVNRYNMAKAGSDAILKDQLPTWQREFADMRLQRNTAELANRLVEDPKTMTSFTNGINNFVLNTPSIDDGSRNMIVQALSKLTNDYVTHPNIETAKSIVNFQSTISQYAQKRYSKDNLTEYLNHISSNPYQPQGATTSNSMGIRRKR